MRPPAGLEATGATVSLDELLAIEQARAADPDPTPGRRARGTLDRRSARIGPL